MTPFPTIEPLPDLIVAPVVRAALAEDLGRAGDITAQACVPADARLTADFAARRGGVVSGLSCIRLALAELDPAATFHALAVDGHVVPAGTAMARVSGNARAILTAERTALNLLGRMCGIATLTQDYVDAVAGTKARITDTRKTTPGLRALEKYAVRCGGGFNHRFGLDDAILIKDNHIAVAGGVKAVLQRARAHAGHLVKIEIEVDTLDQLREVLATGLADVVMLDNMDIPTLREAVAITDRRVVLEVSGGVTLASIGEIAKTGVDYVSAGALTHSAPNFDVALDIDA